MALPPLTYRSVPLVTAHAIKSSRHALPGNNVAVKQGPRAQPWRALCVGAVTHAWHGVYRIPARCVEVRGAKVVARKDVQEMPARQFHSAGVRHRRHLLRPTELTDAVQGMGPA